MRLLHAIAFCGVILVGAEQLVGPRGGEGLLPSSAGKLAAELPKHAGGAERFGAAADHVGGGAAIDLPIAAAPPEPASALAPVLGVAGLPVAAPRTGLVEAPGKV